ncbi:hypothetical protein, partial [Teichococcus wenyumeiae]
RVRRRQEAERRQRDLARRREATERQMAELRAALEAEEEEIALLHSEDAEREAALERDRDAMYRHRNAAE